MSEDELAAVLPIPIDVGVDNGENAETIAELRSSAAEIAPEGLTLLVTGGPAFAADIASSFDGADLTLLFMTAAIVAILLIVTYRSPIFWLVPLSAVAIADGLAGRVTEAIEALGHRPNVSWPYFGQIAHRIQAEAQRRGCPLLVAETEGTIEHELNVLKGFNTHVIDGLILFPNRSGSAPY